MLPSNYFPTLYNRDDWIDAYTTLTLNTVDQRYNRKYGTNYSSDLYISGNIYQSGSLVNLSYISGITAGTALGSKALVLDSSRSVTNIYSLTMDMAGPGLNIPALKFNGTTFNQNYYINITEGNAVASQAVVLSSLKDIIGLGLVSGSIINGTSLVSGTACDFGSYKLNGVSADVSTLTSLTLGAFSTSKAMTLSSSGVGLMGLGNATSNSLRFYGGTAFKEIVCVFRDSDDAGLTIATKAQTIQKCSPMLQLYSGYDQTGVTGTSSAEYKEVIRSNHKLVGFSDNYQSGWFHGYLLGTPPWKSSGFAYCTQFYTSLEALNICCNSSTVSSFTSGANLLLTNQGQLCLNTTTPQSGYQFTMNGTSSYNGIRMNGTNTMLYMQNLNNSTTDRTEIIMAGNSVNWQFGAGNSGHTVPNGFYFFMEMELTELLLHQEVVLELIHRLQYLHYMLLEVVRLVDLPMEHVL